MLSQNEKNILSFIKPYAIEDRKLLMRDNFIDEKIKNMNLEEIRETIVSLDKKGYLKAQVFITDTVLIKEVFQKGIDFDQPKDDLDVMPTFSFKRGNFISNYDNVDNDEKLSENNCSKFDNNHSENNDSFDGDSDKDYKNKDFTYDKNIDKDSSLRCDFDSSNYYINQNTDFLDIKKMIFSDERISEDDQKILLKLIVLIETMTDSNVPLPKGAFSEYEDVISKYGWIADFIGRVLVNKYFLA